jgi:hypothetical protein
MHGTVRIIIECQNSQVGLSDSNGFVRPEVLSGCKCFEYRTSTLLMASGAQQRGNDDILQLRYRELKVACARTRDSSRIGPISERSIFPNFYQPKFWFQKSGSFFWSGSSRIEQNKQINFPQMTAISEFWNRTYRRAVPGPHAPDSR